MSASQRGRKKTRPDHKSYYTRLFQGFFHHVTTWCVERDDGFCDSGRHLVTADDFGGVNLFNHPCVVQDAPFRRGGGHSSHVMNARFSPDDNWVGWSSTPLTRSFYYL